jgi:hypothetical protein
MKGKYSFANFKKSIRNTGLAAIVAGPLLFAGCEGGDGGSDTENVWRAYPSRGNYEYLANQPISALNLSEGDGVNDLSTSGYVDFTTEQAAINYLGTGSSSGGDDHDESPGGDDGGSDGGGV